MINMPSCKQDILLLRMQPEMQIMHCIQEDQINSAKE